MARQLTTRTVQVKVIDNVLTSLYKDLTYFNSVLGSKTTKEQGARLKAVTYNVTDILKLIGELTNIRAQIETKPTKPVLTKSKCVKYSEEYNSNELAEKVTTSTALKLWGPYCQSDVKPLDYCQSDDMTYGVGNLLKPEELRKLEYGNALTPEQIRDILDRTTFVRPLEPPERDGIKDLALVAAVATKVADIVRLEF